MSVIWYWVADAAFGNGETEERESEMKDKTEERESNKILLFFSRLATVQFYV